MKPRSKPIWLIALLLLVTSCRSPAATQISPVTSQPYPEAVQETEDLVTEETEDLVTEEPELTPTLPPFEPASRATITPSSTWPDPHVEIDLEQTLYKPGDLITITGVPVDIGHPDYSLVIRDQEAQDAEPVVQVSYENKPTLLSGKSRVLEFVSVEASAERVTFILRAKSAGTTTVTILATGEVNTGYPGPAISAEGAGEIVIVVEG
jgi:hypothetical protein